MYPGPTRRISARSSRRWSTRSRPAATRSRGPSSTGAEDVDRHARLAVDVLPDSALVPARRRLRALPRPGGAARRARGPRPARRHGPRTGRRERTPQPRRSLGDATHGAAGARGRRRVGLAARPARRGRAGGAREELRDRLRRRSRAVRARVTWRGPGGGRLVTGGDGIPLRRLAQRAQERAPARACVRARGEGELAFVGDGPLRGALEGRPNIHLAGTVDHGGVADVDRRRRRRLPAEPRGAVRALDARGPRVGTIRRRDERRRPARVRARRARASSSTRPTTTPVRSGSTRRRCCRVRTSRRGAPPRRTTSGGRRSGWRSFCFVLQLLEIGKPDLDERRTASSSPAARAASSAAS